MLLTRIVSALVAIGILVPIAGWGGIKGISFLVALFGTIAVWELSGKFSGLAAFPRRAMTLLLSLAVVAAFHSFSLAGVAAVVVWLPLIVLLIHLLLYNVVENTIESSSQMIFILAYVSIPLAHAILLRRLDFGLAWVFLVLVVICLGDAGAYFAGKYRGRHRFSSHVSPSKTVEGLLGGVAGSFAGMLSIKLIVPDLAPLGTLAELTLLLALAGPLGDLAASAIKRRLSIKDFGTIFPGHGGVLDRADSLIPAFPAAYYFLVLSGLTVMS